MILCDMNLEPYDIAENLNVFFIKRIFQIRPKEATHGSSPEFALAQKTTVQARPFL